MLNRFLEMKCSKWQLLIVLLLFSYLLYHTTASRQCSGNQITWVTKSNSFIKCSPCPPCLPGQEYSIPCSSTAVEGTIGTCQNCPRGTYSKHFDNKPCNPCTTCSTQFYLRKCTPFRNAKCGQCKPGYFKAAVVFGCIECVKCCHDNNDVAPPGCKEVGMCKPPSRICPSSTLSPPKSSTTSQPKTTTTPLQPKTSVRKLDWLGRGRSNKTQSGISLKTSLPGEIESTPKAKRYLTTALHSPTPTPTPNVTVLQQITAKPDVSQLQAQQSKTNNQTGSDYSIGFYVMLALFIAACVAVVLAFVCWRKEKNNQKNRYVIHYSRSSSHEPTPMPNDMKLSEFMDKEPDVCDEVCTLLFAKSTGGAFYFDSVACRFMLSSEDRDALKAEQHRGNNPARVLMEKLRSGDPNTTVRQFAEKVRSLTEKKSDNNCTRVCEKLKPFFNVQPPSQ